MRERRSQRGAFMANPVLVGALTVLVVIVATFLAYNANNGLPFVPTRTLKVQLTNGANLLPGNEVRVGGSRIGFVQDMDPVSLGNGVTGAEATLKIDKKYAEIPTDSTVLVRPRSALGLKYLELTLGTAQTTFRNGDTISVKQSSTPVEFDEVFGIFDKKTRAATVTNLHEFGDGLAGRGTGIGEAVGDLPNLFGHLTPVMATLASKATQLPRFIDSLDRSARAVAPVSPQLADFFTQAARTFDALAADPAKLQLTIAKSPSTLAVSTRSLQVQQPFLRQFAALSRDLAPVTADLRDTLPTINRALKVGTPVQRRAVQLSDDLRTLLKAADQLATAPGTPMALRGLTATVDTLNPQLRYLGPYVTVCDSWNYFWTFTAEHFSELDNTGNAQRALLNMAPMATNGFGSQTATHPANGETSSTQPSAPKQYAQNQPYPAAVAPSGQADCEAGQRGFLQRKAQYLPGNYNVAIDPRTPGLQGPTYKGLPRVPKGETFTASPETGPFSQGIFQQLKDGE